MNEKESSSPEPTTKPVVEEPTPKMKEKSVETPLGEGESKEEEITEQVTAPKDEEKEFAKKTKAKKPKKASSKKAKKPTAEDEKSPPQTKPPKDEEEKNE